MKNIKAILLFVILTVSFGAADLLSAQTWTQISSPATNWNSIACSVDGDKLAITAGAESGGGIYTSTNSGATWTKSSAPDTHWNCVVSSSNGNKLAAAEWDTGKIHTSTNSGLTWVSDNIPELNWGCLACSSDGSKIVAAGFHPGTICTSTNSGYSWTLTCTNHVIWNGLASSADGKTFIAVGTEYVDTSANSVADIGGAIYISTNSGISWTKSLAPDGEWGCVSASADGTKFVVGGSAMQIIGDMTDPVNMVRTSFHGQFCVSTNSGKTWKTVRLGSSWSSVAASADGTKVFAVSGSGLFFTSINSGINWRYARTPETNFCRVVSSANGDKAIVIFQSGSIYIVQ